MAIYLIDLEESHVILRCEVYSHYSLYRIEYIYIHTYTSENIDTVCVLKFPETLTNSSEATYLIDSEEPHVILRCEVYSHHDLS